MKLIGKKLAAELVVVGLIVASVLGLKFSLVMVIAVVVPLGAFIWGEGWVDSEALRIEAEKGVELWRSTKGKDKAFWSAMLGPVYSLVESLTNIKVAEPETVIGLVAATVAYILRQALIEKAALRKLVTNKRYSIIRKEDSDAVQGKAETKET